MEREYKYITACKRCGKEFGSMDRKRKYCSRECYKSQCKDFDLEYKNTNYKKIKPQSVKRKKNKQQELIDITVAARKVGMTYGQYVAKMGL